MMSLRTRTSLLVRLRDATDAVAWSDFVSIYELVMPYIGGGNLQQRIDRDGPLEVDELLRIGLQIAEGLAAAHRQGLVHRDIKPANILLEEGGHRVLISDFGLARALDDASLTQSGLIAGTPPYMSPEQARGDTADYRSDLFSLGSVLYAMATARPPFRGESSLAVLRQIGEKPVTPVREINEQMPAWLDRLIVLVLGIVVGTLMLNQKRPGVDAPVRGVGGAAIATPPTTAEPNTTKNRQRPMPMPTVAGETPPSDGARSRRFGPDPVDREIEALRINIEQLRSELPEDANRQRNVTSE